MTDVAPSPPGVQPQPRRWPGRELTAGGVTLHVRETPGPDGVPAVYVHGLAGSATNWTDLAGLLSSRAAGTAVDLPGFGQSRPLTVPDWTPSGHADALLCFLAGRGQRVHLLGNSLGGLVAVAVAARRPELVETLTLVSPAMPDRRPDPRRILDKRLLLATVPGRFGRRARAELRAMTANERAAHVIALCFGDPSIVPEHRLSDLAREIEERGSLAWAREAHYQTGRLLLASWVVGPSPWPLAARVQAPTLVLWGDRDRLVSPGLARRTAAVTRGRLQMLPGVGHVGQIEAPAAVAAAVTRMWDDVAAGRWEEPARTTR
ncbi:MAG: alpha/beta fold hydrolase [Pseudonocardia sp.]|nr:alpha/beta fold hydrolase [Pseudonocardia sp.]